MFDNLRRLEIYRLKSDSVTISSEYPVSKIIGLLRDQDIYEVFISVGEKIGMVTTRDILNVSNITSRKISSLINFVPKLSPHDTVGNAARLMNEYRIRALPIVEGKEISGQITALSIMNEMKDSDEEDVRVHNIMTSHPIVISRDDPASKARHIMIRRRVDHLPVLDRFKLFGIVTSSIIVFSMLPTSSVGRGALGAEKQIRLDFPVDRILDRTVLTCNIDDRISLVLKEVIDQHSTYSIATLWDEVQGIVTYRDFIKLVAQEQVRQDIPIYMIGLPSDPFEAETARTKFTRTVTTLRKRFPEIEEARSVIKVAKESGERRRYEVDVAIKTPYRTLVYSQSGWDLPSIYDLITDRMKRPLSKRPSRRKSERKMGSIE